jgi:hypothetical protein
LSTGSRTAAGERSRAARESRRAAGGTGSGRTPRGPGGATGARWRAVVIPILIVLTLVVIFEANSDPAAPTSTVAAPASSAAPAGTVAASRPAPATEAAAPPADPTMGDDAAAVDPAPSAPAVVADPNNTDTVGHIAASIAAGALPAGADFAITGAGTWHVVPGTTPMMGTGEQHSTYMIEVEDGLQTPEEDQLFAAEVDATLADPRSWIGGGAVSLARIDSGEPDFRISLTSQLTIRGSCGWEVPLEASCYNGWAGRVFINDARWVRGAMSFNGDLAAYRAYAVNHEVGHALGNGHQPCPAQGAPAPVMMQQSWSTSDDDLSLLDPQRIPRDGNVCLANPYPYPAAPAPPAPTAAAG